MELLDKYGDSDEAEAKIAEEMGWPNEGQASEEPEEEQMSVEEINAICDAAANQPPPEPDPHREGIDWIRTEDGDLRHPLQHRCFESSVKFSKQARALGVNRILHKSKTTFKEIDEAIKAELGHQLPPGGSYGAHPMVW